MQSPSAHLASWFQAVAGVLRENRQLLNQADTFNGNHGDHLLEAFTAAQQAVQDQAEADLPAAMELAAARLEQLTGNASARLYGSGLRQFANQFRQHQVGLEDLVQYVGGLLDDASGPGKERPAATTAHGEVLKALLAGLAGWQQAENKPVPVNPLLDMAYLFDLGVIYMQARQRGGSKAEVIADAAATASPMGKIPYRYQSGKIAIRAFLLAMKETQ